MKCTVKHSLSYANHEKTNLVNARIEFMVRFPEIDFGRGVAVVVMIIYHALFDIAFIFNFISLPWWFWSYTSRIVAGVFLLIVGMSLYLSHQKKASNRAILIKGGKILALGGLLTLVSWLVLPAWAIAFGILHLIGVSIMLALPLINSPKAVWLGLLVVLVGVAINSSGIHDSSGWFIPLGITPAFWQTLDYYPLLPWFGVVLIGLGCGQRWYTEGVRHWQLPRVISHHLTTRPGRVIVWIGQHALWLYLIHQPVILITLFWFNQF